MQAGPGFDLAGGNQVTQNAQAHTQPNNEWLRPRAAPSAEYSRTPFGSRASASCLLRATHSMFFESRRKEERKEGLLPVRGLNTQTAAYFFSLNFGKKGIERAHEMTSRSPVRSPVVRHGQYRRMRADGTTPRPVHRAHSMRITIVALALGCPSLTAQNEKPSVDMGGQLLQVQQHPPMQTDWCSRTCLPSVFLRRSGFRRRTFRR